MPRPFGSKNKPKTGLPVRKTQASYESAAEVFKERLSAFMEREVALLEKKIRLDEKRNNR